MFIGLIDKGLKVSATAEASCPGSCPAPSGAAPNITYPLCDVTKCETTATVPSTGGTIEVCVLDTDPTSGTQGTFQKKEIVTAVTNATSAPQSSIGWILYMPTKEKIISRPLAVGGVVDFLSYKPSSDICEHGGDSYLYALDYTTGVPPSNVAIRALGSTLDPSDPVTAAPAGSGGDGGRNRRFKTTAGAGVVIAKSVLLGPGAPPTGEAIIITPPKHGKEELKKKIQVATGVIVETENKPVISTVSKVIHWLKK
jgi:type IV pilus assembly protein PilY1